MNPLLTLAALCLLLTLPLPARAGNEGADGRFERRDSSHFSLFQDVDIDRRSGFRGSDRFEREILAELERAHGRLEEFLGLRPPRRIQVWIYDPALFDAQFAGLFRFPVAGFYGGAIRVRGDTQVTDRLAGTLHHELVHAAFDAAAPSLVLPAWLNEGTAEWFENRALGKRHLSTREWEVLRKVRLEGVWIPIGMLSAPTLGRFPGDAASLAYLQSYGLVDYLVRRAPRSLPSFIERLVRSRSLERALSQTYRLSSAGLEAALLDELR